MKIVTFFASLLVWNRHLTLSNFTLTYTHTAHSCTQVYWSDSGELVCIASEDAYYILKYNPEGVATALSTNQGIDEDGIEAAFDVIGEIGEVVKTGVWVGDCLIYTNSVNRLNYYVGGKVVTISHLDR